MSEEGSTAATLVMGVRTDTALAELTRLTTALRSLPELAAMLNTQMAGMGSAVYESSKKAAGGMKELEEATKKFGGSSSASLQGGSVSIKAFGGDVVEVAKAVEKNYAEMSEALAAAGFKTKEVLREQVIAHRLAVAERTELDKAYAATQAEAISMNRGLIQAEERAQTLMHQVAVAERLEADKAYAMAQAEAITMNRELIRAEEHAQALMHKVALAERLEADRAYAMAQAEAITMNRALAREAEYAQTLMHKVAVLERIEADKAAAAATRVHAVATGGLNSAQHELHSTLRGVSGALGGLWMTYGSIIPLMAGFAAAASMAGAVQSGKDFEYQMKFIKAITGESTEAMKGLSTELLKMSSGSLFKPVELAGGLRVLAQAGLTAKESLAALPTVMALATAGETDLATAVETTTGIMHAFNLNISDMSHIGDVIATAAAISVTSVAGISESLKQASTVAQQYGLSLEEVSASLVVLAERNIKGSAAGTAFRNMMNELSAPTVKAQTSLDKLGVSLYDATGNAKPLAGVMDELRVSLSKYDASTQNLLAHNIFSERGSKAALAILSKTSEEFQALVTKVGEGAGFLTRVMAELENTVQGKFKGVMSALSVSLNSAFEESSASLMELAANLTSAFRSEGFKTAIKDVGALVMGLTSAIVNHADLIATGGVLYLAYKAWMGVSFLLSAEIATMTGVTYGAATAMRFLTAAMMANPLSALLVLLVAGGAAMLTYKLNTDQATEAQKSSNEAAATAVDLLKKENKALDDLIEAKERELGVRKSVEEDKKASIQGQRESLLAEIGVLNADPRTSKGQALLGQLARGEIGRLSPQAIYYDDEIKQARRLNAVITEEAAISAAMYANEEKALKLTDLKLLAEIELDKLKKPSGTEHLNAADLRGDKATPYEREIASAIRATSMVEAHTEAVLAETAAIQAGTRGVDAMVMAHKHSDEVEAALSKGGRLAGKLTEAEQLKVLNDAELRDEADFADKVAMAGQAKVVAFAKTTDGINKEADALRRNAEALEINGKGATDSAVAQALVAIAYEKTTRTVIEAEEAQRLSAAASKDASTARLELDKMGTTLEAQLIKVRAVSVEDTEKTEEQKVEAVRAATLKILDLHMAQAEAASGLATDSVARANLEAAQRKYLENTVTANAIADTEIANARAKITATSWKKSVKEIEDIAHHGFLRIGDKGVDAWKQMTDTFKKMFKNTVLEYIYKELAKPMVLKIIASVAGVMGAGGMATAADVALGNTGAGGAGGWLSAGSSLNSAYSTVTGGFSSGYASFATSSVGQSMGLGTAGSYTSSIPAIGYQGTETAAAVSEMGATVGTALSYVGAGLAGIAIGSAIAGDKKVMGIDGTSAAAIGAVIGGMVFGPIGALAGGVLGGAFNAAFGMGDRKSGDTTLAGSFSQSGFSGAYQTPWHQDGGWFRSDKNGVDYQGVNAQQQAGLSSIVAGSASVFGNLIAASNSANRSLEGWTFAINQQVSTTEQQKQLTIDLSNSMGKFLVPEIVALRATGEALADTAVRMRDEFVLTDRVAALLGKDTSTAFGGVGLASAAMRDNLVNLMGGMTTLTSSMQGYYTNFFSATERHNFDLQEMTKTLGQLGVASIPQTNAQYRALVEAQDLSTSAGQRMFASLVGLSGAFNAVTQAGDAASAQVIEAARVAAETEAALAAKRRGMEINLMELTGNAAGALAARRADEMAALDASLRPLQEQINAQTDLGTAYDKASAAMKEMKLLTTDTFATLLDYTRYMRLASNAGISGADANLPPTPDTTFIPGSSNNDANKELVGAIDELRAELQAGQIALAQYMAETAKILRRWEGGGMPEVRTIV